MQLRSLELINFRSHAKSQLEFDGRPLVITGQNGAGKTNLLEAISLFSPGRGLRRAKRDELPRSGGALGWKLTLKGEVSDPFEIINQARLGEARQILINDKAAPQNRMAEFLRPIWMVPSQDRLWMDSASERRRFFDRMVLSFDTKHGEAVLNYEKSMAERNRLLKENAQDHAWYRAIEEQMAEASQKIIKGRNAALERLNAEMNNAQTHFPRALLSLRYEGNFDNCDDAAAIWEENRAADRYAGITKLGPHRADFEALYLAKNQPAGLTSTGEQKALLTSLVLANARALISDGAFVVVLLDEVAAHIDEARRGHLFDELVAMNAQIIMTGTEANLFDALGERGAYVEIFEENLISKVKPK